jgi:hypothetical protein
LPPNPRYLIYFLYSSYFFIFKKIVIYSLWSAGQYASMFFYF